MIKSPAAPAELEATKKKKRGTRAMGAITRSRRTYSCPKIIGASS